MNEAPPSPPEGPSREGGGAGLADRRFRQRTELTREKDVFRHLLPWEDTYKPRSLHLPAFAKHPLQTCPDTALAAFAQLCVLRLHARRCLVSLITSDTEFVLVDIAKTTTLQHDAAIHDPLDQTWIGTCCFPRQQGINHEAVDEWRKARRMRDVPEQPDHYYQESTTQHWSLISDVRRRSHLHQLPFLANGSWIRFSVSVPLRAAHGSVIGAITVLDDKPRFGVSATEMNFLEDLADTTVEHLNATISRCQRQRGERLIQALGLFNGGKTSLRDWWLGQDDARVLGTGRHAVKGGLQDREARADAEFGAPRPSSDRHPAIDNDADEQSPSAPGDYFASHGEMQESGKGPSTEAATPAPASEPMKPSTRLSRPAEGEHNDNVDPATPSSTAYARASNLLREAIGVDGVVFADTSAMTGNRGNETSGPHANVTSDSTVQKRFSDGESSESGPEGTKLCKVQAFSTRNRSSVNGFHPEAHRFPLPERNLQRLITRYPSGVIFHFDRQGKSFTSSDDNSSEPSSNEEPTVDVRRRFRGGRLLTQAIKGARTVALYPLWDDGIDRWRSCIIVWSNSPHRYFDQTEELVYLKAFGHSLVAELSRLENLAIDKAKGTFISSISHETRSPLHGIMAGVELLEETELTLFQEEMLHSISMAGRTLLDTMNHILDYSKISNHMRGAQRTVQNGGKIKGSLRRAGSKSDVNGREINKGIDLARLTEEVVETTVTAHRSQYQTPLLPRSTAVSPGESTFEEASKRSRSEVSVILDIDFRENWAVKLQSGAWTRILTNLLGNALKYTATGHISVRLTAGQSKTQGNVQTAPIELIVEDTGIGISEAFQTQGLFMPFKQEDHHSTGAGLGLSIVKYLAKDMDATLDIESKQGRGTKVTISVLAEFDAIKDDSALEVDSLLRGMAVDQFLLLSSPQSEQGSNMSGSEEDVVGDSVLRMAGEWLQCDALRGLKSNTHTSGHSVCAMTENQLRVLEVESPATLARLLDQVAKSHSHLLVLGGSISTLSFKPRTGSWTKKVTPVFIHQPIGPRKLIRAIASDRSSSSQRGQTNRRPGSSPGIQTPTDVSDAEEEDEEDELPLSRPPMIHQTSSSARLGSSSADAGSTCTGTSTTLTTSTVPRSVPASDHDGTRNVDNSGTILLVEDNYVNMKLLVAVMTKLSLKFQCATNGLEALEAYRQAPDKFDLVLMDMSMPVMDGFTATAEIREIEEKRTKKKQRTRPRTAIVALTGATTEESRKRAFDCGVDEYFTKPVRINELRQLVERIREQQQQQQQQQ